jgi:hypothetical protein
MGGPSQLLGHGSRLFGRRCADGGWRGVGSAPVIHSVALGGPVCRAGLRGSIKKAAVRCGWRPDIGASSPERAQALGVAGPGRRQMRGGPRRRHDFHRARQAGGFEGADLAVAQSVEAEREDLGLLPAGVVSSGRVGLWVSEGIVPGLGDLGWRSVVQPRVGPVVVAVDVSADHLARFVEGLELVQPDAALLEF